MVFQVVNAGRAGQQLDISVKIRSPAGKLVQYINRKVEDQLLKYSAMEDGDYEICFNNRYSMMEVKKVFWQFEVEALLMRLLPMKSWSMRQRSTS